MSRAIVRNALRNIGEGLIRLAGNPSYVVIYDDAQHEGEDFGENYYGFFADPEEAERMFSTFAQPDPSRYSDVKLCIVLDDMAPPPAFTFPLLASSGAQGAAEEGEQRFARIDDASMARLRRAKAEALARQVEDDRGECIPAAIAISTADKVALGIEHLKKARDLLRAAGAKRALERVRLALSSADGALRHAKLEPYRKARQIDGVMATPATSAVWTSPEDALADIEGLKLPEGADAVISSYREHSMDYRQALSDLTMLGMNYHDADAAIAEARKERWYGYEQEACPSKHWNAGDDFCDDCGADLQGTPDGKEG